MSIGGVLGYLSKLGELLDPDPVSISTSHPTWKINFSERKIGQIVIQILFDDGGLISTCNKMSQDVRFETKTFSLSFI